jgi:riboflavin kinase/FMN adenylyltransferase
VVIHFDREFSAKPAEQFIDEVLVETLQATHVSVGENFTFGQKARGTPQMLAERGEFETRVVPLVEVNGETVSSSHIRGLVAAGEVREASEFLGGPFLFQSEVVHGDKRGRELGFPTANLVPSPDLAVPGHGVYAAWAHGHPAAVNVGIRPTFQTGRGLLIEAYLLDFDDDLYGQQLRVAFVERLRGEKRFESVEDLVAQMELDVQRAREICSATVFRR